MHLTVRSDNRIDSSHKSSECGSENIVFHKAELTYHDCTTSPVQKNDIARDAINNKNAIVLSIDVRSLSLILNDF